MFYFSGFALAQIFGEDNFCPLLRKELLKRDRHVKKYFYTGRHIPEPSNNFVLEDESVARIID